MVMHMKAKKTNGLEKWEFPKKSGIWIREFIYSQNYNDKQRIYSAFQVTVPGRVLGESYKRKRRQLPTKAKAEAWARKMAHGIKL